MSSFYPGLAATASRLIAGKGQVMTLRRLDGGAYDPATGGIVGQVEAAFQIAGVVFDVSAREINGASILTGDRKVTIAGSAPVMPRVGDMIEIETVPHAVVTVKRTAPGGVDVVTQLLVRAGA